jgi:hypothetical protein
VYQQIYDSLIGKYGWDAIWADNDRAASVSLTASTSTVTRRSARASLYINAYPCNTPRRSTKAGAKWGRAPSASMSSPAARSAGIAALRRLRMVGGHQR